MSQSNMPRPDLGLPSIDPYGSMGSPHALELLERERSGQKWMGIIYLLNISGFLTGFTPLIAIVLAHLKRDGLSGTKWESHVIYYIRTFWISVLMTIVGVLLLLVVVGIVVLAFVVVWVLWRTAKSGMAFLDGRPIANPRNFW